MAKHVHESEALAFAMTCRGCRDAMKEDMKRRKGNTVCTGKQRKTLLTTRTRHYRMIDGYVPVSEDWIKWAFSMEWEYGDEDEDSVEQKDELLTHLAGRGGFKDVLIWLKSEGCVLGNDACYGAAYGGHIKVLKYLKSEGVSFDEYTCKAAAEGGHMKVLKYLKSEGVAFDSETCRGAAEGGHIKVLKYLKSEGVPFDSWTCFYAAYGGHPELLKWLKSEEVNCPWDVQGCLDIAKHWKHKEVVTWIKSFLPT